jgi:flagellar protein FliJ
MPAKFEFSLQPLLDRRKRIEEARQRDFVRSRRALADCAEELEALIEVRRRSARELSDAAHASPATELALRDRHLVAVEASIAAQRRRRAELETACERARDELIAASRERRVIEKLEARRRAAFDTERMRREELELDEGNARRRERDARERRAERAAGRAPS